MRKIALLCALLLIYSPCDGWAQNVQQPMPMSYTHILERVAAGKINRFISHAKLNQVTVQDLQAVATSLEMITEVYTADGTFKRMDAEVAAHSEEILSFVPSPSNVEAIYRSLHTRGIVAATREDVFRMHIKTMHDKQIALQAVRAKGMQAIFREAVTEFSARAIAMRSGAALHYRVVNYSLCDMMGDTSGVLGLLSFVGCVPCGIAGAIGFGLSVLCRVA